MDVFDEIRQQKVYAFGKADRAAIAGDILTQVQCEQWLDDLLVLEGLYLEEAK